MTDAMDFPQLPAVTEFLRKESENRVVQTNGLELYECITSCINDIISRTAGHSVGEQCDTNCINKLTKSGCLQAAVVSLLMKHSKQFQSVLNMLIDNVQGFNDDVKQLYDMVISDCRRGSNHQVYTKLLLYATATCINTPIYILHTNEIGKLHWVFYEPLFIYEEQVKHCIKNITMYMSALKTFYPINQHDLVGQENPNATGQLGMYLDILKGITVSFKRNKNINIYLLKSLKY